MSRAETIVGKCECSSVMLLFIEIIKTKGSLNNMSFCLHYLFFRNISVLQHMIMNFVYTKIRALAR